MINGKLLEILACPICKGNLIYEKRNDELICAPCGLGFPVKDEVPIMLSESARSISVSERKEYQ